MDLKSFEWRMELLASANILEAESRQALRVARDIAAALRASRDLPPDFNASNLVSEVWKGQVATGELRSFTGHASIEGTRICVEFTAPADASLAEKDSAFLSALAQKIEINYLQV